MGLFDLFSSIEACPHCMETDAKRFLWMVKCRNRVCEHFDTEWHYAYEELMRTGGTAAVSKRASSAPLTGDFDPGVGAISISYRNHQGELKTFKGDKRTVRLSVKGGHISLRLAPTGKRVTFAKERIQNRSAVDAALPKGPQPRGHELRLLSFHRNRGTTSARFEEIKKKYPGW